MSPIARRDFLRRLVALVGPPLVIGPAADAISLPWTSRPTPGDLARAETSAGTAPSGLTAADVATLTQHYERLRRRVSGAHLIGPVRAHLEFVSRYLRDTSLTAGARRRLLLVGFRRALNSLVRRRGERLWVDRRPGAGELFELGVAEAIEE